MLASSDPQQQAICQPPGSRLFIVCGRAVEEATLQAAFAPFGVIQNIKLIKEKGVCYVKFDRASSAAAAMEALNGAVLNNGRGPKLKVLLAEAPTPRGAQVAPKVLLPEETASADPDNVPPRSRLFLVVPKTAEARVVHEELSRYPDMEYCKTDLIASKGCVFVKYSKASSALRVLEEIAGKGMLSSYKVKVMLAEPKTKRARPDLSLGLFGMGPLGHLQGLGLDPTGQFSAFGLGAAANSIVAAQQAAALQAAAAAGTLGDYGQPGLMGFSNTHNMAAVAAAAAAAAAGAPGGPSQGMDPLAGQMGLAGFGLGHQGQFMQQQMGLPGPGAADAAAAAAAHQFGSQAHAAHAAAAAAAASAAAGVHPGAFQGAGGHPAAAAVSSGLSSVGFAQLGNPFMGLSPGAGGHSSGGGSSSAGLMTSAGMQQQMQMQQQGDPTHYQQQHQHAQQQGMPGAGPPVSQQRLFVVVHKSVSEDQLRLLFRNYPGCEYCDLKRDKLTGRSKGYCYVNYSTPAAAAAALHDLNGVEYPVGSGFRLKVMYAEIMTSSNATTQAAAPGSGSGSTQAGAPLLRSSSSRSSLGAPQGSGSLGAMLRGSSGNLAMQGHGGSSGALAAAAAGGGGAFGGGGMHQGQVQMMAAGGPTPLSAVTPVSGQGLHGGAAPGAGSTAGSSALLSPAGSDPNSSSSTAPTSMAGMGPGPGLIGSAGPSPAASPLCDAQAMYQHHQQQQQQQQQQNDLARVTDRLSSLSLPNMGAPSPQHGGLGSIGSEHSKELAAVAAAAQHYTDLKGGSMPNTVARELMFNMS